jgi:putative ATPase
LVTDEQAAVALRQQAQNLDGLTRPTIIQGSPRELTALIEAAAQGEVHFDVVLGRNLLTRVDDKATLLATIRSYLQAQGRVVLVETVPRHTQRLYQLLDLSSLDTGLVDKIVAAEEAIYTQADDAMVNWDVEDLADAFKVAGLADIRVLKEEQISQLRIDRTQIERWFDLEAAGPRPTYAQHLQKQLAADEIAQVETLFKNQLTNQLVRWQTTMAFAIGAAPA